MKVRQIVAAATLSGAVVLTGVNLVHAQELTVDDLTPTFYGCQVAVDRPVRPDWEGYLQRVGTVDPAHIHVLLEDGRSHDFPNGRPVTSVFCIGTAPR